MNDQNIPGVGWGCGRILALGAGLAVMVMAGCDVDSFFDPSKTGRFEHMATTIPVLERIDVIEQEDPLWGQTTGVTPDDLVPTDLEYRLAPNDLLSVQIFELYNPNQWYSSTRRIDAAGYFRLPEIGDVQAAGITAQEFEDRVTRLVDAQVVQDPLVDVVIEEGGGFNYTMFGAVGNSGVYALRTSDLHLLDALAIAGGVPLSTQTVLVTRRVVLTDDVRRRDLRRGPEAPPQERPPEEVDIDTLIEQLEDRPPPVQPGLLRQVDQPPIDIDQLEPILPAEPPEVDVDEVIRPDAIPEPKQETFIFDEQRGQWVRVRTEGGQAIPAPEPSRPPLVVERVIEIPFQRLKRGDSSYNIVIRPDDLIYVQEAPTGVVYLEGEVFRPGVYTLPPTGTLTLSRLVAAAGGLGPLAIPERVDLTRVVGPHREATVRMDLRGIRERTLPDVVLRADDHVIVGTNFWASPLAVVRNGFRATYGFGFLLDRNFGNDVFGAPPVNFR